MGSRSSFLETRLCSRISHIPKMYYIEVFLRPLRPHIATRCVRARALRQAVGDPRHAGAGRAVVGARAMVGAARTEREI